MLSFLAAFLGAFLLFFSQPFISKALTPWFGGGSQVWLTCMMFFQVMLLAGYGYAHLLLTRVRPAWRGRVHAGLLALALINLAWTWHGSGRPFLPPPAWGRAFAELPQVGILRALAATLGIPTLVLAATSPLSQAWAQGHRGTSIYRIYALSNAGSLSGLLAYPFLVEPFLGLSRQSWLAAALFLIYLPAMLVLSRSARSGAIPAGPGNATPQPVLAWALLAFTGTLVLMAITHTVTTAFSGFPLLWVLPLVLFLVTYIIAFEGRFHLEGRAGWLVLGLFLAALVVLPLAQGTPGPVPQILAYMTALFAGCLFCHARLYALRPPAAHLSTFYFALSMGGAAAGILASLAAPVLFSRDLEFPIAVALVGAVALGTTRGGTRRWLPALPALGCLAFTVHWAFHEYRLHNHSYRDYYGQVTVGSLVQGQLRVMSHGNTVHGMEWMARPLLPAAYYRPESGIARALRSARAGKSALNWGVVGLGVGNVLSHAQAGDRIRVYEISPKIIRIAGPEAQEFTVFRSCPGPCALIAGDGRRVLEQEAASTGSHGFDLLLLDAYSGGNVPASLLTLEAFRIYLGHLAPSGLLVFNATNLLPIDRLLLAQARALGLSAVVVNFPSAENPGALTSLDRRSCYVVASRDPWRLLNLELAGAARAILIPDGARGPGFTASPEFNRRLQAGRAMADGIRPWTDDRNSLSRLIFHR